ncbi:hypothetical protein B188_28260 [Candidatus Brocadiaceae bacterium B188]|nr:hypothetical protein B188_28260 [Candidatus Brocadiaceae bacterium B188]
MLKKGVKGNKGSLYSVSEEGKAGQRSCNYR